MADVLLGNLIVNITARNLLGPTLASAQKQLLQFAKGSAVAVSGTGKVIGKGFSRGIKSSLRDSEKHVGLFTKDVGKKMDAFAYQMQHYLSFSIAVQLVGGSIRAMKSMIDLSITFQRAAVNAATVSGYLGDEFERAVSHIRDVSITLSKTTVFTANEAANSFYTLASAGYDVTNIYEKDLLPIMNYAAATQLDLATATQYVIVALKQFNLGIQESQRVVDTLTKTITSTLAKADSLAEGMKYVGAVAGSLGISLEETAAALGILINRGVQGSQAGQMLRMTLLKLLDPTEKAERTLAQLGLTLRDVDPSTHSLAEILEKLAEAGFDAATAAKVLSARSATGAVILVDNAREVANLTKQLENAQGVTEQIAEKQLQTMWGALKLVTSAIQGASLQILHGFEPVLIGLAEVIKNVMVPSLQNLLSPFANIIKILSSFAADSRIGKVAFYTLASALMMLVTAMLATYTVTKMVIPMMHSLYAQGILAYSGFLPMILALGLLIGLFEGFNVSTDKAEKGNEGLRKSLKGLKLGITALAGMFATYNLLVYKATLATKLHSLWTAIATKANYSYGKSWAWVIWHAMIYRKTVLVAMGTTLTFLGVAIGLLMTYGDKLNKTQKLIASLGIVISSLVVGWKILTWQIHLATAAETEFAAVQGVATMGISIAIGLLIAYIASLGDFSVTLRKAKNGLKDFFAKLGIGTSVAEDNVKKFREMRGILDELRSSEDSVKDLEDALVYIRAKNKKEIEETISPHAKYIAQIMSEDEIVQKLNETQEKQYELRNKLKKSLESLFPKESKYLEYLKTQKDLESQVEDAQKNRDKAYSSLSSKVQELVDAELEGNKTEADLAELRSEILDYSRDYAKASEDLINLSTDLADANSKLSEEYEKLPEDLQRAADGLKAVNDLVYLQSTGFAQLTSMYSKFSSIRTSFTGTNLEKKRNKIQKDMAQNTKDLLDVTYKLYEIQKKQVSSTSKLFKELAKSGLLTKDLIDGYVKLQSTQGEVISENVKFSNLLDRYPKHASNIRTFMGIYEKGLTDGKSQQEAWSDAIRLTGDNLSYLTSEDISFLEDYGRDIADLTTQTNSFADSIGTTGDQLAEMGVLSQPAISALNDVKTATYNARIEQAKYNDLLWDAEDIMKRNVKTSIASAFASDNLNRNNNNLYTRIMLVNDALSQQGGELGELAKEVNARIGPMAGLSQFFKITTSGVSATEMLNDVLSKYPDEVVTFYESLINTAGDYSDELFGLNSEQDEFIKYLSKYDARLAAEIKGFNTLTDAINATKEALNNFPEFKKKIELTIETNLEQAQESEEKKAAKYKPSATRHISGGYVLPGGLEEENGKRKVPLIDYISDVIGSALKSIGLQSGGIVTRPTLANIAETYHPEAVLPLDRFWDKVGPPPMSGEGTEEKINIYGDVNIEGIANFDEFMLELKRRANAV